MACDKPSSGKGGRRVLTGCNAIGSGSSRTRRDTADVSRTSPTASTASEATGVLLVWADANWFRAGDLERCDEAMTHKSGPLTTYIQRYLQHDTRSCQYDHWWTHMRHHSTNSECKKKETKNGQKNKYINRSGSWYHGPCNPYTKGSLQHKTTHHDHKWTPMWHHIKIKGRDL